MERKNKSDLQQPENIENVNLGLDSDHSSDGATVSARFNDDNDRISGKPDGESDDSDDNDSGTYTSLEDK